MTFTRRSIAATALAAPFVLAGTGASAQAWPARGVRIIVPFAPGGSADLAARFVADRLGQALGQPFTVENRPGAGSVVGTEAAMRAPADGYTILTITNAHTANETLLPNRPFVLLRDFVPVAPATIATNLVAVHPSVPANTMQELIALARARPGTLNFASSGPGTVYHIAGEDLKQRTGINIVHVPYRGAAEARTDLIGGQVQIMFDAIPSMIQHARAGRVRVLATTGSRRSDLLPDVPTVQEAGVPGFEAVLWVGFVAPAGTPPEAVQRFNDAMRQLMSTPAAREHWHRQGAEALVMTPPEFRAYVQRDIDQLGQLIRTARITAS